MNGPILVEVIGVDPPCKRCAIAQKNTAQAASKLKDEGIEITIRKLDIASKDTVLKYGVVLSPAIAIDGKVKVAGRVPSSDEIARIVRESVS